MSARGRVWALILTAFAVRFAGVGFGIYHADEPIVVNHALQYATGDLNPHFFKIPPLVSYLCFGLYGAWFVLGKLIGVFGSAADFQALFMERPEIFYQAGRVALGALPGTATVWAVWAFVRKLSTERAALWAAAAMAFNFLHARDSHSLYTDMLMTLLVVASAAAGAAFLKRPDARRAVWAGLAVGAAAAAKYNALLAGAAVLAAWLLVSRKVSTAAAVLIGTAAAFIVLNPFALLDFTTFWAEVTAQATAEGPVPLTHLFGYSLAESCGWGVLILAAAGAASFLAADRRTALVVWAFPAVFFIKLLFFSQPHERYVLPIIPFLAMAFGMGVELVLKAAEQRGKSRTLVVCVAASTLLFGAVKIVKTDALFLEPDTRDQAREWILRTLPGGSSIAFTDTRLRPRLDRDRLQWEEDPARIEANAKTRMEYEASKQKSGYRLSFIQERPLAPFAGVWPAVPASVDALRARGVRYVVAHHGTEGTPDWRAELSKDGKLLKRFSPYKDPERNRPLEDWSVTFAAYAWPELSSRTRFGPVLEVYEL
jgi:4-amino-4-deoxy-L-arabinose transferase-like glycosyltransferase